MLNPASSPVSKKKNPLKTNLVLAAILVAVGLFAYLYDVKYKAKRSDSTDENPKLVTIDETKEIESVSLVGDGAETHLVCTAHCKLNDPNAKWDLQKPIAFKADEGSVGSLVNSFSNSRVQETIPVEGDLEKTLAQYGLGQDKRDKNKIVVKVKSETQPYVLYFGDKSAIGENLYAYFTGPGVVDPKKGPTIKILPSYLRSNAQRPPNHWRSKKIFEFAASEVEGLSLKNAQGTVQVERKEMDWVFSKDKKKADNETLDSFVTGLIYTTAREYVSDDKAKDRARLRLGPSPKYFLEIKLAKKPPVQFAVFETFGKPGSKNASDLKTFATLGHKNFIVELDRTAVEKFNKKASDFAFKEKPKDPTPTTPPASHGHDHAGEHKD